VKEYLDIREINGYTIEMVALHTTTTTTSITFQAPINCLVYIGLPSNPQFMGPQTLNALAAHIFRSRGPSGENKEYLYMLEEALEGLAKEVGESVGEVDEHVSDLAARVKLIESREREGKGR